MARRSPSLHPPPERVGSRAGWQLGLASAAVLLGAADTYVVVLVLPNMLGGVGLSLDHLQEAAPIISGFLLGYVAMLPLVGRLSDNYGRTPALVGCLVTFALGSALTAGAHTLATVVVGRTIQGLGGGGLVPVTLALVADLWPAPRRGLPLGVVGAVQELGSVVGPLYGALVVALAGWRAIFWINLPVGAGLAAGLVATRRRASAPRPAVGLGAAAGASPPVLAPLGALARAGDRPDLVGGVLAGLAVAGGVLFLAAPTALATSITWGQLYEPLAGGRWAGASTPLALITLGLAFAFAAWELVAPVLPMVPARLPSPVRPRAPVRLRGPVRPLIPLRQLPAAMRSSDTTGAILLGGALACIIVAFATADPGHQVLGSQARVALPIAAGLAGLFAWREIHCRVPLVDFHAFSARPAYGAILTNLAVGAALMAALVDLPIFARVTRFPGSQLDAALVLVRFLAAVPVGAVLGGIACRRLSRRGAAGVDLGRRAASGVDLGRRAASGAALANPAVTAVGMALAAAMFGVMTTWSNTTLGSQLASGFPLHASDLVLVACGLGFGLAIAPVNSAMLGAVRPQLHGVASALVVVARSIGMLVGLSVLTAVGLHRFFAAQTHIGSPLRLCPASPGNCQAYQTAVSHAVLSELHTIFLGAAICAALAAVLGAALLGGEAVEPD